MKCSNCGNEIGNVTGNCPICGAVQDSSYGDPNFDSYQDNKYTNNNSAYVTNQDFGYISTPNYELYLILSILYTIFCWGFIEGALAIVFTVLMDKAYRNKDMKNYTLYRRVAKWLLIGGIILKVAVVLYSFAAFMGLLIGDPGLWTYTYT